VGKDKAMSNLDVERKKKWVKQRYGAIAAADENCCEQSACGCGSSEATARKIGYEEADLAAVPEGANLGLGCGNPLALASIKSGETVLDLGSGAGFDALLAGRRVGKKGRVIGVDITPAMVRKARANAKRASLSNVEFRLGDLEALPVEDASVDLVISNCVLNMVPDKPKAFREIARVLKPGGRIAISDIVLDASLPDALRGDEDAYCSCIAGAVSRSDYLAALADAGLEDIEVVSEADASELLAADCCGAGLRRSDLEGVVTSVHVVGRKPVSSRGQAIGERGP
jgi:SAM-dependent methyltransferase